MHDDISTCAGGAHGGTLQLLVECQAGMPECVHQLGVLHGHLLSFDAVIRRESELTLSFGAGPLEGMSVCPQTNATSYR